MINAIELNNTASDSYINEYGNVLNYLPDIKHINIFLGENNSGKSRFMRLLVNSKDAEMLTDEIKEIVKPEVELCRKRLQTIINNMAENNSDIKVHEYHNQMSASNMYVYYVEYFNSLNISQRKFTHYNVQTELSNTFSRLNQIIKTENTRDRQNALSSVTRVYIPVLRGVESYNLYYDLKKDEKLNSLSMNKEQRDALEEYKDNAIKIYKNKISSAYKINQENIFTGEDLFIDIRDKLLGKESGRRMIHDFESFISDSFYDGERFAIIPVINEGCLYVKIGDSEERALHDLGDGIKQLICILYKVFEQKDNEAIFFIEEPEINLHPGYQRKLIDILRNPEFERLYFFITTHSNHFVDRYFDCGDISIYKFFNVNKANNQFQIINTSPGDIDLLNTLGVNNSSVFMANATIWVEGLSDKVYLEKYLNVYVRDNGLKEFKEGVDYSFVEYSGNNITHWSFDDEADDERIKASAITNRAMIIVDNDNDSKQKQRRKEQLKTAFGNRYLELSVREIENTISQKVLEKTLFNSEEPVFKNGMETSRQRLNTKSIYIWEFIDQHYKVPNDKMYWNNQKKQPKENKLKFAKSICSNITSMEDLTEEAKEICERIYSFLEKTHADINE